MINDQPSRIYLDYAATSPVDTRVMETMLPYFKDIFGNSSSIHMYGQQAEAALEQARETMATVLNCRPDEVIFTSCGSESDNLALRGAAFAGRRNRNANHLLISPVEHHAVSVTAEHLAKYHGFEFEYLPIDKYGAVQVKDIAARIRPSTALVSVIYANNEIGTINPIAEVSALCNEHGVPFHTDAVQAAAYLTIDVEALKVDLLSLGAHKFYGPKGIGALYVRRGTALIPQVTGGGQEFRLRAGTHNIPYIVGMAAALKYSHEDRENRVSHVKALRDNLIGRILEDIPESQLTGHPEKRMPNHASFVFHNLDGNTLLTMLDTEGFACSSGSACKTGSPEPSEVLTALNLSRDWALGSLRVTLGTATTPDEVTSFCNALPEIIKRARKLFAS